MLNPIRLHRQIRVVPPTLRRVAKRHLTLCAELLLALVIAPTGAVAAADPPNEVTLTFIAVMGQKDGYTRLIGVKPSPETLKLVELHPGDFVTFRVQRNDAVFEKWSQKYQWTAEHHEGKDTIKEETTQSSWLTTKLKWGVSIAPNLQLGNATVDLSREGDQKEQTQQQFKGAKAQIGESGVQVRTAPGVPRPPRAPADAKTEPVRLETLDSNGKPIVDGSAIPGCTVKIAIVRASAN
jgi:hypothetical protein